MHVIEQGKVLCEYQNSRGCIIDSRDSVDGLKCVYVGTASFQSAVAVWMFVGINRRRKCLRGLWAQYIPI